MLISSIPSYSKVDSVCSYIPLVSTATNLIDLFLKAVRPLLPAVIQKTHLYTYLNEKSWGRCFVLLVPVLGNIAVALYDYIYREKGSVKEPNNNEYIYPLSVHLKTSPHKVKVGAEELYQQAQNLPDEKKEEKLRLYLQAAWEDHPGALYEAGIYLYCDKGTPKDKEKAIELWSKAAQFDHISSIRRLAAYFDVYDEDKKDLNKAIDLYKKAVALGHLSSQSDLARCYAKKGDLDEAEKQYKLALSSRLPFTIYELGSFYENYRKNYKSAVKYYKKAAELHSWFGIESYAKCLQKGRGIPQDQKAAFDWYGKGVKKGSSHSIYKLAQCYEEGLGIEKNIKKAMQLYEEASKKSHLKAKKKVEKLAHSH